MLADGEFNFPCYTISGNAYNFDCQYVDLNKGNLPDRKANAVAIINSGIGNEAVGNSIDAITNRHIVEVQPLANSKTVNRNNALFSQTNWITSTGRDGFISDIDDCLLLADQKYQVTTSSTDAGTVVLNTQNLFRYSNFPITSINYGPEFDDRDMVEITVNIPGTLEVVALYLLIDSINRPNSITLEAHGTSAIVSRSFDLKSIKGNLLTIDGLNTNNTTRLVVKFHGVQDKTKPVTLKRLAAKNKHPYQVCKPFVSIEGGQKVYGELDIKRLRVGGREIKPQPSGATTVAELEAKLRQAGILF
jgi:hypothetical protein